MLLSVRPAFVVKLWLFAGCKAEHFPTKIKNLFCVELSMFAISLLVAKCTVKSFFLWLAAV